MVPLMRVEHRNLRLKENFSVQICYQVGDSILTLHSVIFRFIIFEY